MFDVIADPVFVGGSRLNAGRFHDLEERLHRGRRGLEIAEPIALCDR